MQKINYQQLLDNTIANLNGAVPTVLLHSCCAPCSSACLEVLSQYFSVTVFYFNPNIYPQSEYQHRVDEQRALIEKMPQKHKISLIEGAFEPQIFYDTVAGFEAMKEGGARCFRCYEMRLAETARVAKQHNFDYFTTTLTLSPLKNSAVINEIGAKLSEQYGVRYLFSDFKKKGGYLRSIELSREYNLYRQDYCGCEYSVREE